MEIISHTYVKIPDHDSLDYLGAQKLGEGDLWERQGKSLYS